MLCMHAYARNLEYKTLLRTAFKLHMSCAPASSLHVPCTFDLLRISYFTVCIQKRTPASRLFQNKEEPRAK